MSAPLNTLSPIEQKETIHASVSAAVKQILMFSDQEILPLNQSFFELGLSSLTLQKLKQQLQQQFDLEINMVELFNQPTVVGLVDYIFQTLYQCVGHSEQTEQSAESENHAQNESQDASQFNDLLTSLYYQ